MGRVIFICMSAICISLGILGGAVNAMTFTIETLRDGSQAVRATGQIVPGDVERLDAALMQVEPSISNGKILMLDSPGGNPGVAMEMAEVIDRQTAFTIVSWGDSCGSSCVIVFLAGNARLMLGDGHLWLHSCTTDARRVANVTESNIACNKDVAEFLALQGINPVATSSVFNLSRRNEGQVFFVHQENDVSNFWQPPWLPHQGGEVTPSATLLNPDYGAVFASRDWDQVAHQAPLREPMRPEVNLTKFASNWLPPDEWSHGLVYDGASIAFRRYGHFPQGPELELQCYVDFGDDWLLFVRHHNIETAAALSQLLLRYGEETVRLEPLFKRRLENSTLGSEASDAAEMGFRVPYNLVRALFLSEADALDVSFFNAGGELIEQIRAPWQTAERRILQLPNLCAGLFNDMR